MARVSPQLICFSYHKSGTSLLWHVMTKISARLGLRLANHYGLVEHLDPGPDIVLLPHSIVRAPIDQPYRAIRMIRDPRDIWVSGYLYHRRCVEEWCINTDLDVTPPILWPIVDHSIAHCPEDWKRRYIERLNGRSYQANLLERPRQEGLAFELENYTGWTLKTMRDWPLSGVDALDVKLEDVMADFDGAMLRIFNHFGFTAEQSQAALDVARSEDIRRMDDSAIAERPQITSRAISKWRDVLSPEQVAHFESAHGDLIHALGYKLTSDPQQLGRSDPPNASRLAKPPAQNLGIHLAVDDILVSPTITGRGTYRFVVPAEARRAVLLSQRGSPSDQSDTRILGVKVTEIAIRTETWELVIAADDPRLITGWHAAEHADGALWRWTDGAGELPWQGILGPALVTIRCSTL